MLIIFLFIFILFKKFDFLTNYNFHSFILQFRIEAFEKREFIKFPNKEIETIDMVSIRIDD